MRFNKGRFEGSARLARQIPRKRRESSQNGTTRINCTDNFSKNSTRNLFPSPFDVYFLWILKNRENVDYASTTVIITRRKTCYIYINSITRTQFGLNFREC